MTKKFRETKFGKLFLEKLPNAADVVGDLLPSNGLFGVVKNLIDLADLSGHGKEELARDLEKELKEFELQNQNTADARDLQKTALQQEDRFSKRFIYFLAAFWTIFTALYIAGVTFIPLPENNKDIANIIIGFLTGTIAGTIVNYFFGSSKGSSDKTKLFTTLTNK